jgi:hypothetical protein
MPTIEELTKELKRLANVKLGIKNRALDVELEKHRTPSGDMKLSTDTQRALKERDIQTTLEMHRTPSGSVRYQVDKQFETQNKQLDEFKKQQKKRIDSLFDGDTIWGIRR